MFTTVKIYFNTDTSDGDAVYVVPRHAQRVHLTYCQIMSQGQRRTKGFYVVNASGVLRSDEVALEEMERPKHFLLELHAMSTADYLPSTLPLYEAMCLRCLWQREHNVRMKEGLRHRTRPHSHG